MLVYTVVVNVFHVMLMHYMSPSYLIVCGICSDLHVVVFLSMSSFRSSMKQNESFRMFSV